MLDEVVGEGAWARQCLVFDKWTVDAAIPKLRLIIQADGSYWHGFDPETHLHPMVAKNLANDARQAAYVEKIGWTLLRLWEHDLKDRPSWCVDQIRQALIIASTDGTDDDLSSN